MTIPLCSFIDLEGVLVPEMWPHLAAEFEIVELEATTREVPDYRRLMNERISALARRRITLTQICEAVARLTPFEGALDFIRQLRTAGRVVIVSDSFRPMNSHFLKMLSVDSVLCHDFTTSPDGIVDGFRYWNELAGKHLCFQKFDLGPCRTFAMGDALNDITMIRSATHGVLFRASPTTIASAPGIPTITTYAQALRAIA